MYGGGFRSKVLLVVAMAWLAGCEREGDAAAESTVAAAGDTTEAHAVLAANLPPGVTPQMAEDGRQLFLPCAVCHGLDGRGNQLGPSLRDTVWTNISGSLAEIEGLIRIGVAAPDSYPVPMAPMGGGAFDDGELRAVAAYVFAISHNPAQQSP